MHRLFGRFPNYCSEQVAERFPVLEDAVRAPVRWRERADLAGLAGRTVSVLVELWAGTFYAVRL